MEQPGRALNPEHDISAAARRCRHTRCAPSSDFLLLKVVAAPFFGWLCRYYRRWSIVGWGIILWSLASAASGLAGLGKTQVDGGAGGMWLLVGTFGFLFASRTMKLGEVNDDSLTTKYFSILVVKRV